ncbi:enoyl-CoA hydratase/isomerase family protein [Variovorax paradoxus]|uniref:enoyl-CoA hydratase/isomerase family protein n=1 Tax=Variovorax paradoxus TaxID=34073 RepID=UPI00041A57EA
MMDAPQDELVLIARRGAHLVLTLNRADKANAMTVAMVEALTAQITQAANDANIRAIVLTANGDRVFCAGVDVREKPADGDMAAQRERRSHALAALQDAVIDVPKPVVVSLNGTATGAGAMIALMADACVAVDSASIGLPEIDLGIASFSGANILTVIGGRALALDLIQNGRKMPSGEALTRGLVRTVAARAELEGAAQAAADVLAAKDAQAFADNKHWINRGLKAALAEARAEHARHRAKAVEK